MFMCFAFIGFVCPHKAFGGGKNQPSSQICQGSEKGVFWKRVPEILENLEILELLENPTLWKTKGESDHVSRDSDSFEILEIPPVKRPLW